MTISDDIIYTILISILITCIVLMYLCFIRIAHINKKNYDVERKKYIVDIRSISTANVIVNPIHKDDVDSLV